MTPTKKETRTCMSTKVYHCTKVQIPFATEFFWGLSSASQHHEPCRRAMRDIADFPIYAEFLVSGPARFALRQDAP